MRFSVIIPAHNAEDFLGRALASIDQQTFLDYEVIVVADACADGTADVAIAHGHTPLVSTAGAPGPARNAGMDRAEGDYLLFLDADDWFLRADAFARIAEAIEQTDEPHLLHYGFMWGTTPFGGIQPAQAPHHGGHWHHVWSRAWHRNAIGDSRMVPMPAGQDTVFTMSLMEKPGLTHAVYDFPLVQHVLDRPGSVTHTHLRRKRAGDMSMMDGLMDFLRAEQEKARGTPSPPTR